MYIIQPAACTAVEKKQNDMLIDHPHQDYLILSIMFLFLLVTLLFFWVLQNLVLQFCLTVSLKLNGKVKLPVWEILCDGCKSGFFISMFLTASVKTLYAAFFSYSDNCGNFLKPFIDEHLCTSSVVEIHWLFEITHHETPSLCAQLIFFQMIMSFSLVWTNQVLKWDPWSAKRTTVFMCVVSCWII